MSKRTRTRADSDDSEVEIDSDMEQTPNPRASLKNKPPAASTKTTATSSSNDKNEDAEEEEEVEEEEEQQITSATGYTNKQRVLLIASRGITARYRYLLEDLKKLIPHHKTDNKLDDKGDIQAVNEIAEMKSCNQVIYLETRKHQDLYMYMGKTPHGPSVKFHVVNVHTMDELKLTGNCMIGSRPLLDFDASFEKTPHFQLMKQLLSDAFGTPLGHPKSKPFVDRVMSFYLVKNNIWVRNYQIIQKTENAKDKEMQLVEIGPRFVLIPIRVFLGSMGGPTLYQNQAFVTPNSERASAKRSKGDRYTERVQHRTERKDFLAANPKVQDELSSHNVFK